MFIRDNPNQPDYIFHRQRPQWATFTKMRGKDLKPPGGTRKSVGAPLAGHAARSRREQNLTPAHN
jgi:hypothetical protein